MKVYALIINSSSMEPIVSDFEIEERLIGKKLLWEIDDLDISSVQSHDDYEPIRFIKYKETSLGTIGYGPYGPRYGIFMAASY